MIHSYQSLLRRSARLTAAGIFLAGLNFVALPLSAAPAPAAVAQFGSVDLQKTLAGYTKKADLDRQIQDMQTRLDAQFKRQLNSAMLNKDEQTELGALLSKTAPTDADRARITELEAKSAKDSQELAALQQKKDPTDADKARLDVLTKQQVAGQQALQDISNSFQEQLREQQDKLSAQLSESVKTAISAVAQQRGLAVVFDSQVAIYTANDITDDVLKRLNK